MSIEKFAEKKTMLSIGNLDDGLIAYGKDGRAGHVPWSELARSDKSLDLTVGAFPFSTDASVHADHWERHPAGDEILCVLAGRLLVDVQHDGTSEEVRVDAGHVLIVPQGSWHRLRVLVPGRLLAVTPRAGTTLRPHRREEDVA
jgi:mannose-6-phosphate isomerase-like protein (cupin superfamily)